ncbi:sporulation integral membrane protein YtvI [Bacillus sp. HMF5848]|uniref:sporulation integral membrane protein YtvI n=1 Tax=Bacillus sp. HMF5848 TaxID=2495421 RepID=UPI000F7B5D40|nr:sporulation integral membrane protein YtvI [Bacillus sp. HMF5848]RSK28133.1 sporulation integral membrane protein YtvI [Bacillus sp. HMF5848]
MLNKNSLYLFLRLLFVIAIVVGGSIALYYTATLTYPFIIAIIIALMINPIVNFFELRTRMPRSLAVFTTLIIILAFAAGLLTLVVAEVYNGTVYLSNTLPQHIDKLALYIEELIAGQIIPFYNQLTTLFKNLNADQQTTIITNIENVGQNLADNIGSFLSNVLAIIPAFLKWMPNAATVLVFSFLATFFISKDWDKLRRLSRKVLPVKARTSSKTVFVDLQKALVGFLKAQATLISITAIIILIGLLIFRVEHALTVALLIGIVDVLPYLGTGLVFVPWVIYSAVSGNVLLAIQLAILYIIVMVVRQLLEPKVLSQSIGLDPLATLVSLFVGFKLIGFLGLIAGPVVLVIIKTLHTAKVFEDIWAFIKGKPA